MGEIVVKGPGSLDFLQKVVTNDVAKLSPNKAQYTFMCYENGGIIDDFLIYMIAENHYLLVVNAANTTKDYDWLLEQNRNNEQVIIEDVSDTFALLALQGPLAEQIIQKVTDEKMSEIKPFSFKNNVKINQTNFDALISRTGY